ncbi:MAG: N-acetylmuramic acid/N-acetylglucosamine kinase [Elusimicrobia bacterium]|nr:N-acetylmuramic acid/N-acetylglucosamine kinase [Elusimicrobiota bacterium]
MNLFADIGGTNIRFWTEGTGRKIEKLVLGMRGVWTPQEKKHWKNKFRHLAPIVHVLSDIELAHELAFGKNPGIVLNAGTGSIAFGRSQKGKTARTGGLGPLLGDEGSAFWIGKEFLRMQYQIIPEIHVVRRYITGPDAVKKIAGVAKKVLAVSQKKPGSYERRIADEALIHLRELVKEIRFKLKLPPDTPVHLTGGLFNNKFFKNRCKKFLSRV